MEKSPLNQRQITRDKVFTDIQIYVKMRNIRIPVSIMRTSNGIKMDFIFSNTKIEFKATSKNKMYENSIKFIEEMNDEYHTPPVGVYLLDIPV